MRAFSVLQKWPKIAKMSPNDLLILKMFFTEPLSSNPSLMYSTNVKNSVYCIVKSNSQKFQNNEESKHDRIKTIFSKMENLK